MTLTDSKGKVLRAPKDDADAASSIKFSWWRSDTDEELAQNIAGTIRFLEDHQNARREQLTVSTRLYGNTDGAGIAGSAFTRAAAAAPNPMNQRISYNLCQSVIDTLVSKIAKNKVQPTFVTSGGIWSMQRKAEKLSKFTEGCFYQNDVHKKVVMQFRDGGIWGDGILHVYEDGDEIGVERVLPHELLVDQVESLVTKPGQMHRVKMLSRDDVKEMFPDMADEIDALQSPNYQEVGGAATISDLLNVSESWHLRSGKEATDGLKVICAGDLVLDKQEWKKDYFPFVIFHYNKRPLGFWGQGACERLQPLQGEINRSMILEQRSRWMQGSFKILLENGSKVVSQHLNNDVGTIIHYTGTPPQYITPPAINPDNQRYIDSLIAKGYQQEGVSQMSAAAVKPAGVNSGKAMRTLDDIEADRFLFMQQDLEGCVLELGRQMIETAKDIYKRKKTYKTTFVTTRFMETIDWADIKLEDDEYVMKSYPTSTLPNDPAGRLETIQEYMQAGLISPRAGRKLMAMPDVEMSDALANATEDLLHKIFEDMLDDGDYKAPEPFYDLQLAKQMCLEYLNYAELHNCPEDRLDLLRDFNAQLDELIPPPPGMAPPGVSPMANPQPTPTSNMIPNVAGAA